MPPGADLFGGGGVTSRTLMSDVPQSSRCITVPSPMSIGPMASYSKPSVSL